MATALEASIAPSRMTTAEVSAKPNVEPSPPTAHEKANPVRSTPGKASRAIANAVRLAARGVEHDVVGRLAQRIDATVLASRPSTTPTPT